MSGVSSQFQLTGDTDPEILPKLVGGRPPIYQDTFPEQVFKLCLLGSIDSDIADFFGVSVGTVNQWKIDHPKFHESIKAGKRQADANVASRLYDRAMGSEVVEETAFKLKSTQIGPNGKKTGETEDIKIVPVRKQVPPDTTAAIFWLKNRNSHNWRDRDNNVGVIILQAPPNQSLADSLPVAMSNDVIEAE